MSNGIYVLVPTGYAIGDAFVVDNYANSNFGNGAYKKIKYVVQGVSFIEEFDGQLDQCTVQYLSNSSRKISQYVPVKVVVAHTTEADKIYDFVVSGDVPVRQTPMNSKYRYMHTLSLVEPTVYLEKWVMPGHANTRKWTRYGSSATLYDQVIDELDIARGPKPNRSNIIIDRFKIQNLSTLMLKLASRPAEEFFFDSPPLLREVLDEMFRSINARVRVSSVDPTYNNVNLTYQSYDTVRDDTIYLPANVNGNISNSAFDKLSKNLEVHGQNAISSNRLLVITDWDTFKSIDGSATLTTDNMGICTQHPIEKIEKLEISVVIKFQKKTVVNHAFNAVIAAATGAVYDLFANIASALGLTEEQTETFEYQIAIDISDYIYEKEDYDRLSANDQMKALYYKKGDTNSSVGKQETFLFVPISAMTYIIKDKLTGLDNNGNLDHNSTGYKVLNFVTDLWNKFDTWFQGLNNSISTLFGLLEDTSGSIYNVNSMMYRLKYVPYIDPHARFTKDNAISTIPETNQIDNQSEKSIDVLRFGDVEKNKINVLGNSVVNINCVANSLADLISLGKIINNGSLCITGREYSVYANHIEVAYKLDADFQALRNKVKLDRERRVYEIPLASDQIDRKTLIKRFIQIGDEAIITDPAIIDLTHLSYLLQPWRYEEGSLLYSGNSAIKYGIFTPTWANYDANHYDALPGSYQMNVARYSMATSSFFCLKLYDNYSAGLGTGSRVLGGRKILLNRYVNKHTGRYEGFQLQLAYDRADLDNTYADHLESVRKLPLITSGKFSYETINDAVVYKYPKDAFDRDIFTVQYEFVSNSNNLIVGSKMAQINGLMVEGAPSEEVYLWISIADTYPKNATKCLGVKAGKFKDFTSQGSGTVSIEVVTNDGKFYLRIYRNITLLSSAKAIAFGTTNGDILFAYNIPDAVFDGGLTHFDIFFAGSFERKYNANFEVNEGYTIHYIVSSNYPGNDQPADVYNALKLPSSLPTLSHPLVTFHGWTYAYLNEDGETYTVTDNYAHANASLSEDVYLYARWVRNDIIVV